MKSITILGQKYFIKRVKGLADDQGYQGLCDGSKYVILLDSKLKGKHLERVFYHEVAHAFCFECGLAEFLGRECLEMFAQSFSGLISQIKGQLYP